MRGVLGVPMLWDPVSGEIAEAQSYSMSEQTPSQEAAVKLTLSFDEYESMFVVIDRNADRRKGAADTPDRTKRIDIPGPWQVRNGADEYRRVFSAEVQLPADWPAGSPARLELKGASQILRVQVNGKPAGERFCSPYRFEVGEHLHSGVNRIEIERVGRYSSPVPIMNMGNLSFTDDKSATVPCQQATIIPHGISK
jgi:hypothetical protein